MRYLIFSQLLIFGIIVSAQKTSGYAPAEYKSTTCKSSFIKIKLEGKPGVETVQALLNNTNDHLKDKQAGLKLNYVNESPGGYHYSFTQLFHGVPVYQSEIKVNTDKSGVVHSIFDNSYNTSGWQVNTEKADANSMIAIDPKTNQAVLVEHTVEKGHLETLRSNGSLIFQTDIASYANAPDSTVSGTVFNPDPLTTSEHIYDSSTIYQSTGEFDGPWTDEPWLDSQEQVHTFKAYFDGDSFRLQSPFVMLTNYDTGAPDVRPVASANGVFNYNRSQSGFQDVNAFYHISAYHDYVHSLGFNCADSFVYIDTHAMWDDNSYFTWGVYPCQIWYGVGGVPDAEDADVVVHEYCHSLSYTAAPQSNQGFERRSIDEGFCDYNAASYSRSLNTFYDFWVYNWDGHNQFWPGRIVNSTGVYPQDLADGDIYTSGQLWSAALFSLQGDLNRGIVDSLILQTNYSYAINISMADCAQLLIDADTILYGGSHYCAIYNRLLEHGFVPLSEKDDCSLTAINQQTSEFPIRFMQGGNWFTIATDGSEKYNMQVLSITGQQVAPVITVQDAVYNYQNSNISAGVYLVNVTGENLHQTFKWLNTGK